MVAVRTIPIQIAIPIPIPIPIAIAIAIWRKEHGSASQEAPPLSASLREPVSR